MGELEVHAFIAHGSSYAGPQTCPFLVDWVGIPETLYIKTQNTGIQKIISNNNDNDNNNNNINSSTNKLKLTNTYT